MRSLAGVLIYVIGKVFDDILKANVITGFTGISVGVLWKNRSEDVFQGLAHGIMEASTSEICKAGQQAGNSRQNFCYNLGADFFFFFFFQETSVFAHKAFN